MSPANDMAPGINPGAATPGAPRAVLSDLQKSYGAVQAVKSATVSLAAGKVTAIVGENGAGKSTLVKMLAGVETPDSGTIEISGARVRFHSARDAALAGVGMVFQEMALVPGLKVWENVVLGWESRTLKGLDKHVIESRMDKIATEYGLRVPINAQVDDLAVSLQQQVEIAKVLYREAEIIILDEPTGVLTPQEAQGLFRAMRTLRDAGKSVIFISHKLNEVLDIADEIYVMRAGEIVAHTTPGDMAPRDLAKLMLGNELPTVSREAVGELSVTPVLETRGLECTQLGSPIPVGPVNLSVRGGEVLGIAGVAGSGQDEFIATVTALQPALRGEVLFNGFKSVVVDQNAVPHRAVRELRDAGLAYVPSDRGKVATLETKPLWFSAVAGRQWQRRFTKKSGILSKKKARSFAQSIIADGAVKASGVEAHPASLSGGNLQKFIVARELASTPRVLIAEEPTRGIDVGSAVGIRQRFRDIAASGSAVIVVSSDLDELMDVSDRIAVFFDGKVIAEMDRSDATVERVGAAMTGLTEAEEGS